VGVKTEEHQVQLKTIAVSLAVIALEGCTTPDPTASAPCPTQISGYMAGQATAEFVKRCLGTPLSEDHNKDGRFVYLYNTNETPTAKIITSFLFDSGGKLIRTRPYSMQK